MHCAWHGDYHSLGLTRIQFYSQNVTPLTKTAKVMDQGSCYCNSNAWKWNNRNQSRVICKPKSLFSRMEKSSEVYRRNNSGPKTLPYGTPDTSTSLLQQPSTIMCCDWFDRNCVSIDNTETPIPTEQRL